MELEDDEDNEQREEIELPIYTTEQLEAFNADELKRDIGILEAERNKLKGNINMNALLDYLRKDANYK